VPALRALCERLRVPSACRELAELLARELGPVHRSATLDAAATVRLLERCDAIRRPQRFAQLLLAFECDARGRTGPDPTACRPAQRLAWAAERIGAVPTAALAAQAGARGLVGPQIAQVIHAARVAALERALAESPD
jgi:tRNA nucleotidyltransferase (CCA-adding enzyme)